METIKYSKVIDHFIELFAKRTIDKRTAWWTTQAVIFCALSDKQVCPREYCLLYDYRDELLEK